MPFITRALHLIVVGSGATFAAQGVNRAQKWFRETFSAPPEPVASLPEVTAESTSPSETETTSTLEVSQPEPQAPTSAPESPPKKPVPPPLIKVLEEEGYEGCVDLKGWRWKLLLYVCWKKGDTKTPSFFHYDKSKVKLGTQAKADQIINIAYNSYSSVEMKFKDETSDKTHKLDNPLPWMRKFKDKPLTPESECSFSKDEEYKSSSVYKLNCRNQFIQKGIQM